MELPSSEQRLFYERAATQYQNDLAGDTNAQAYLQSRGIGPEAAATFRLGVLRNPLAGHEQYRGRLALPYLTPQGVITFSFRCLAGHDCKETVLGVDPETGKERYCKKYTAPEGVDRMLYNVLAFKLDSETIYVCEGEIDAITLSICGFPAVAVPGVKNWKPFFDRPFNDYVHVYCVADGDKAGRELAKLLVNEIKAHPIRPPRGEDVNSLYVKGGIDGVRQWLSGAVS